MKYVLLLLAVSAGTYSASGSTGRSTIYDVTRVSNVARALPDGVFTAPQVVSKRGAQTDTELGTDPHIISGTLPNGISYMIRRNGRPENRAELRLVVNAGSILEDDDQRGLAHFVEHMAFNGTKHFEKQAIVDFLESTGMRFGADLNAYTSFDETVYKLQLPSDSLDILNKGLLILRDWAGDVTFEPAEIEKERGVVIEEWRSRLGGNARIRDRQLPVILNNSKYADRIPIGTIESIQNFEPDALLRFYRDWYRTDLLSIIAVGDFDPEFVRSSIMALFSDLEAGSDIEKRPVFDVPASSTPLYSIESDPEATIAQVSLLYRHTPLLERTEADYRDGLLSSLMIRMLNTRFGELVQSADPPFIAAGSQDQHLVRTRSAYSLGAIVRAGMYERAIRVLLREAKRVETHGFTSGELDRARTDLLRSTEIAYNERDKTSSGRFASEYVRHIVSGEPVPGIEAEFRMMREMMPGISLIDVDQLIEPRMADPDLVISVSGPDNPEQPLPDSSDIERIIQEGREASVDAYVDSVDDQPLVSELSAPGAIVSERTDSTIGVTYLTLTNGIQVILRPTDFKNDQILVRATSPGGTSLAPDSTYMSASFASQLVASSGIATFGPVELDKKLAGKAVSLRPVIGSLSEGFSGSASPEDLETLFSLIYLYGTQPRADTSVYSSLMTRIASVVAVMKNNPRSIFGDTLSTTLSRNHFRTRPISTRLLSEIKFEPGVSFFKDRFSDFSDFTFYFVGAFDLDSIRPLLRKYVANLPATGRIERWKDIGVRPPDGIVEKTVRAGVEPQASVALVFTGEHPWSLEQSRRLNLLEQILGIRLREILREDLGGTYGVSVSTSLRDRPYGSSRVNISFGCAPERADELTQRVLTEINNLQTQPPDESYLEKAREATIRQHETGLRENGYWLRNLQFYNDHGLDPDLIPEGPVTAVKLITPGMISETVREYLRLDNYVRVTLLPVGEESDE